MLKRFFTPKWQHQDSSVREQALVGLDASNDVEVIMKLATDDPSSKIRELALSKLSDISLLKSLLSESKSPAEWCRFALRINQVSPQIEFLTSEFKKVKSNWDKDETFKMVASYTSSEDEMELTNALLLSIDHPDALFKIATSAKSVESRLKAVSDIKDIEVLNRLSKKATNKSVLQAVRLKLTEAKTHQKIINDTIISAQKLASGLEKLSKQSWVDAQFESKVNLTIKNWQSLNLAQVETTVESKKKELSDCLDIFQKALITCQGIMNDNKLAIEQVAIQQETLDKQNALCHQLQNLTEEMVDPSMDSLESYQSVKTAFEFLNKNWLQTIAEFQPEKKALHTYSKLQEQLQAQLLPWENFISLRAGFEEFFSSEPISEYDVLRSWLKRWQALNHKLGWSKKLARPELVSKCYESVTKYQGQYDKIVTSQNKKAKYLNQKIGLLEKHCQQRNLIAANKLVNYINKKLNDSISDFRASLSRKLENIQPQLDELRDWHAFATGPKKAELCEVMEQLSTELMEPLVKAKKVREFQQQWRELLASDPIADDESWERFKKASDIAYLPCLEYYAEKDKARADNLQKRQDVCEFLEQIIKENGWNTSVPEQPVIQELPLKQDGVEPEPLSNKSFKKDIDWNGIDQLFNKANNDWKKYQPVPENERQSIQDHFNAVQSVVRDRLATEKQANLDSRCELVAQAVKFHELKGADELIQVEKSIKGVMLLQKQWKQLGLTFYKAEHEQWRLFRSAIDKVFAKRDSLKKQFKSDLQSNLEKLKDITNQIEELCKKDDEHLKASFEQFENLKQSWSFDTELPRSISQSLLKAFEKSCNQYRDHYAGINQRQEKLALSSFLKGVEVIRVVEEKWLQANTTTIQKSDLEQLQNELSQLRCDEKGRALLDQRFSHIKANDAPMENQTGLKQLQNLALSMEILLAIDSPESCKEQRMSIQLEQLQKGIGTSRPSTNNLKEVLKMFNTWVTIGFINQTERAELESRRIKIFTVVGL
ncbi:MAG: exonuclease SbcC [Polaribacter sp.]|jgi:exonuclease SbcC